MKKLLSFILLLVMIISIIPMGILSTNAATSGYYTYEVENGEATITDCDESVSGDIIIPSTLDGYPVKSIGSEAFKNCSLLESVTIPNTVKSIEFFAFFKCTNLSSITIPDSKIDIAYDAFNGTAYSKNSNNWINYALYVGNHLITMDYVSIYDNDIYNYEIINGTKTISKNAFIDCSDLTTITIPESIIYVPDGAFFWCTGLKELDVDSNNSCYSSEYGVLFNKNKTKLIHYPSDKNGESYSIPNGVTDIASGAFYCSKIKNITIPISVTSIGSVAFWSCSLSMVNYEGSEKMWKKINISDENQKLLSAEFKYNNNCIHKYTTTTKKATTSQNGKIVKKCTVCGKNGGTTKINYPKTIKLSATSYVYNGKVKTPTVTVKDSAGKALKKNTDYTVTYANGRKNVGKYAVTIKFKGNYSGTKTLYFTIKPVSTTVKSLTAGKKSLKVAITKKTTQVTGYQIQYATNKNFKSAKTKTVTSYKTTSVNLTNLSSKKTYYVRVRTYKTVNGVKYYSAWSTAKYKKTK